MHKTETPRKKNIVTILVLVLNFVLVLALFVSFFFYDNSYKQNLYNQNLDDIQNINQASANIASFFFQGREVKLRDIGQYLAENQLTPEEAMEYIYRSNTDSDRIFELIGADFKGYCLQKDQNGNFIPLDYSSGYSAMLPIFKSASVKADDQFVRFAAEFTDAYSAMTSFALYNYIPLMDETGTLQPYTLLVVAKSADFINFINIDNSYSSLATAIINKSGDYIIGNSNFKSTNFYKFLGVFNDLSLDEQKAIRADMAEQQKGSLAYNDASGQLCVFVYTPVPDKDWFCVTEVPVNSFRNTNREFSFTLTVAGIMLILLLADLAHFLSLNRRLRDSAEKEKVASVAKTTFLSQMSHEIRTPMNAIIGMARLAEETQMSNDTREYIGKIENASQYLLDVLNDILDMSRIESGRFELHPEWVHGGKLIRTCMDVLLPEIQRKKINFTGIPDALDAHVELFVDPLRLKQILMNLLNNAIKFTPEGGQISLHMDVQYTDDAHRLDTVTVSDTGCGMSEEFLQRIFKPFEQEQNPYSGLVQGTGLGLALVKQIITAMGGDISVTSKLGEGSCFTFHLPMQYRLTDATDTPVLQNAQSNLQGIHLLLVEDNPLNREIACKLLERKGMIIEQAVDGEKGVQAFAESAAGTYDAILMDIRMPIMDGLAATRAIRALPREDAKTVPIIAMTANAFDDDMKQSKEAGMNAHLAKPINPQLLYDTLADYMPKKM